MKKILLIILLTAFLLSGLMAAEQAVIKQITGKVKLKGPGKNWIAAETGMNVKNGTVISTGFNSGVVIELDESVLEVKQLTRMTLEELVRKEGTVKTVLFLQIGNIEAEIKSVESLEHDFKLRSPVSTAIVCGSSLKYNGTTLKVKNGMAILLNMLGQQTSVGSGQRGSTRGFDMTTSEQSLSAISDVVPIISGKKEIVDVVDYEYPEPSSTTALIKINVEWPQLIDSGGSR